jgi:hypothetical protein
MQTSNGPIRGPLWRALSTLLTRIVLLGTMTRRTKGQAVYAGEVSRSGFNSCSAGSQMIPTLADHTRWLLRVLSTAALWIIPTGLPAQTPTQITISDLSLRRDGVGPNDLNFATGDQIELSATVTPNAFQGTTATAQTTNLSTGLLYGPTVFPFVPFTANPNYYNLSIPWEQDLTGPWTVTFSNNTTTPPTATATTNSIENVAPAPPPINVTISGSSLNPTFSWSYPSSVDGMQINIYDTAVLIGGIADNVYSVDVPFNQPFTVPTTFDVVTR